MAPYVRADVRRAQLLEAAQQVLSRDGLDRLTLRAVADEAGVRLSTLQYIFSSRAELVSELAGHVLGQSGRAELVVGSRGLEAEMRELVGLYTAPVLGDRPMVELIRAEFVAGANAALSDEPVVHPAGDPILGDLIGQRVVEACAASDETYDVDPEVLAEVWSLGLTGVLWRFLRDDDLDAFRREGNLVVDALVALANPQSSA